MRKSILPITASLAALTLVGLAVLLLLLLAATATACPKASLADIEDEVTCPVCGTTLQVAESPQAKRERVFIRNLIARCKTKDEIKAALERQFGPAVLAVPPQSGFSLSAYLVPILVILAALLAVSLGMLRWHRRPGAAATVTESQITSERQRQLEEDLKRWDES